MNHKNILSAVIFSLSMVFCPTVLQGQESATSWLDPSNIGNLTPSVNFSNRSYLNAAISDQSERLGMQRYKLDVAAPIAQREKVDDFSLLGHFDVLDLQTGGMLPDTHDHLPSIFYDPGLGGRYRRRLDEGSMTGVSVLVDSPSDRPFGAIRDVGVNAMGFLTRPAGERDTWLFFLNYASDREFLPHVPIPGVAYQRFFSPGNMVILGVPFCVARVEPIKEVFWLEASYFFITKVHAQANLRLGRLLSGPLTLFSNFDWDNHRFYRHDCRDDDERLFYYEKRIGGGIRWDLSDKLFLLAGSGLAFDRFFFEGEDYGNRHDHRVGIEAAPYFTAQFGLRF